MKAVSFKSMGRLGNVLFEAAAAAAYCLKHEIDHVFSSDMNFNCQFHGFSTLPVEVLERVSYWDEPSHKFSEIPKFNADVLLIRGFFQSYRYFHEYEWDIQEMFHPEWKMISNTCAVHVRRGDYLLYPTKHPVVTEEYLDRAISCMEVNHRAVLFIFFTDDPVWVKEYLSKKKVRYLISENKTPIEDLKLMSCCAHQIISNSSFSFWGAYLNRNEKKSVITPHHENWFGIDNRHLDCSDLLPPSWEKIKYQ